MYAEDVDFKFKVERLNGQGGRGGQKGQRFPYGKQKQTDTTQYNIDVAVCCEENANTYDTLASWDADETDKIWSDSFLLLFRFVYFLSFVSFGIAAKSQMPTIRNSNLMAKNCYF